MGKSDQITVRLDPATRAAIKQQADLEGEPEGVIVRRCLRYCVGHGLLTPPVLHIEEDEKKRDPGAR